jgi:predicted nucleic acid-binding protein
MTLVDSCVWIDHFRSPDRLLASLLEADEVLCHPFVIGELAAGTLKNRAIILAELDHFDALPIAAEDEVRTLVETRRVWGLGIGWLDLHLLAAALISGTNILTYDKRLAEAAKKLGIGFPVQ